MKFFKEYENIINKYIETGQKAIVQVRYIRLLSVLNRAGWDRSL